MTTTATAPIPDYPVRFDVDYPEGPRNRLTVFFRLLLAIPIFVILALLSGGSTSTWRDAGGDRTPGMMVERLRDSAPGAGAVTRVQERRGDNRFRSAGTAAGGVVVAPTVLMLLFRRKYPRWWFDWNLEFQRFSNRVGAFVLLLRDEYPSTDEQQAVHLEVDYPDAMQLNRWLPLVKWFLAIPHYLVLALLALGLVFAVILSWFAILVTGRFPRGMFDYVVGVMRWGMRVAGYAFLLVTDRYPPFSTR